jgi:hypothetical protein
MMEKMWEGIKGNEMVIRKMKKKKIEKKEYERRGEGEENVG